MNNDFETPTPNNNHESNNGHNLLEQLSVAQEFINAVNQNTAYDSAHFSSEEINSTRIQDEKALFEHAVGDVVEFIMKIDAIGEKDVAQALSKIYGMDINNASELTQATLEKMR